MAFDPSVGGEIRKTRPAVIVSNKAANMALNRVTVVPLSTKTTKVFPGQALVVLSGESRKAMADQLTTAAKERMRSKFGELSASDVAAVENAILLHLGIRR